MKKHLLLVFVLCFGIFNIVNAQPKKKPIKKPTIFVPPIIKNVTKTPPPPEYKEGVGIVSPSPTGVSPVPSIMDSPDNIKYRKERICTDCDTLKLEANKRHIIIYDVKWMTDPDNRTYRKQPTKNDLSNSYYALSGKNKREWDELQKNFPEDKFSFHHIYRNTYIEIPNSKHQVYNFLNRQDRHEGFIFWSGNVNDSTVISKQMALLTEKVSKQVGEKKISSYYNDFIKDSLDIVNYQKNINPSPNIASNMNAFLQKEIFRDEIIPFQFISFNNVKKITVQSVKEPRKKYSFLFNNKEQLTKIYDRESDSTTVNYVNNLPSSFNRYHQISKIYYQGDQVIIVESNYLRVFKLINKVFVLTNRYNIDKNSYSDLTLSDGYVSETTQNNNELCVTETFKSDDRLNKTCYSNTNWTLPLTLTKSYYNQTDDIKYSKTDNSLLIENQNGYKSSKIEYGLNNDKITGLKTSIKRGGQDFTEPYLLNVTYEYYK